MKLGVNAMCLAKALYEDFEGNVARLKEGGCDYIECKFIRCAGWLE